jgi:AmmeMemoRadiSam system protein A
MRPGKRKILVWLSLALFFVPCAALGQPLKLSKEERDTLLAISRQTLSLYVNEGKRPDPQTGNPPITPTLKKHYGVFVTLRLKKNHELRGCIGYIRGIKPLWEAVVDNTINAATRDGRFTPLKKGEDGLVEIEISVLSVPERVHSVEDIVVGKHGLIIRQGPRRGVLLPQVPVEQGWNLNQYLQAICLKAGLPLDGWKEGAELYVFTTEVVSEGKESAHEKEEEDKS